MAKKIADRAVRVKSQSLKGKDIAFAVCGSIGAVEVVKIIRELRRHEAKVSVFFTPSVEDFVSELSVEWASGERVVKKMGAHVESLEEYDLVLVAPATLNTISKSALGIADNCVTLLIASQLGRRGPVMFVPTMHVQLKQHPKLMEYEEWLKSWGARFFDGEVEEDRLKMPDAEKLVATIVEFLRGK